jgi:hypothetical protein
MPIPHEGISDTRKLREKQLVVSRYELRVKVLPSVCTLYLSTGGP